MKNLDLIGEELFNKIRGRFPSVTIGNEEGLVTNVPNEARFFDFDFKEGDKNLGKVSVSVDEKSLNVMYSNNFIEGQDKFTKEKWYGFLKELRYFAKKRLLNFDTRNITKSNLNRRDYKFLASNSGEQKMSESKMYGTSKTSYQDIGNARLALKHSKPVNQELAAGRTQHIEAIYIESSNGERFKYPFRHLNGARAMAMHVSEGGNAYDEFGKHITGLSEELSKLRKFKNYMNRSSVMAESLAGYMDTVNERIETVKKTVENLQKQSRYKEAFESYEQTVYEDVPEEVASNWIDQLTIRQFNEELKDVFPYIYRLVNEKTKAQELGPEDLLSERNDFAHEVADKLYQNGVRYDYEDEREIIMKMASLVKELGHERVMTDKDFVADVLDSLSDMDHDDDDYDGQPSSYDEYQDLYGGDDNPMDYMDFESFENWADDVVEQGLEDAPVEEGYMQGYKKYHCEDCGCQMHNCKPDCQCEHDSHDETGSWWKDKNGNGVPDALEGNKFSKELKKARDNGDDEMELDGEKIPVTEFVLSLFDRETGQFPKGETAVLTAVEKDYGERYINGAKEFIEAIKHKFEEHSMRQEASAEHDAEMDHMRELAGLSN